MTLRGHARDGLDPPEEHNDFRVIGLSQISQCRPTSDRPCRRPNRRRPNRQQGPAQSLDVRKSFVAFFGETAHDDSFEIFGHVGFKLRGGNHRVAGVRHHHDERTFALERRLPVSAKYIIAPGRRCQPENQVSDPPEPAREPCKAACR